MRYGLLTETFSTLRQQDLDMWGLSLKDLAGVLRLDLLLFNQLVIPDSHLFDGCLLLDQLRPSKLAALTGHTIDSPTIEVRLRAGTFDESLRQYLVQADDSLRPLEFRYLRDTDAERGLAEILARTRDVTRGNEVHKLREVMLSYGISEPRVSMLIDGWDEWRADGLKFGLFGRWQQARFDLAGIVGEMSPVLTEIDSAAGRDLAGRIRTLVVSGDTRSASADRLLRGARDVLSEDELTIIRSWYHDCRQVAIARQQSVNLAVRATEYTERLGQLLSEQGIVANAADNDAAEVRASIYKIASLEAGEFADVYSQTAANRRNFMALKSHSALTQLVRQIVRLIGPDRPASSGSWFAQERIILPVATAAAGYLADGPFAAVATGVLGVGMHLGAEMLTDILRDRRETTSLVRWVANDHLVGGA